MDEANFSRFAAKHGELLEAEKLIDDVHAFEASIVEAIAEAERVESSRHVASTDDIKRQHDAQLEALAEEHRRAVALTKEYQFHVRRKGLGSLHDMMVQSQPGAADEDENTTTAGEAPEQPPASPADEKELDALREKLRIEQDTVAAVQAVHDREVLALRELTQAFAMRRTALDAELRVAKTALRRVEQEEEALRGVMASQGKRAAFVEACAANPRLVQYKPLQRRYADAAYLESLMQPTAAQESRDRFLAEERDHMHRTKVTMEQQRPNGGSPS
jgi:hypothetical protein